MDANTLYLITGATSIILVVLIYIGWSVFRIKRMIIREIENGNN